MNVFRTPSGFTIDLLQRVPVKYKAFFGTLLLTGIRCSEALGLQWADVDFSPDDPAITVRRGFYRGTAGEPKSSLALRDRPMVPELREMLVHHKAMAAHRQTTDYVFAGVHGNPWNPDTLRSVLKTALRAMGVHFDRPHVDGLHLLRHTSGSLVYQRSGGDLVRTQQWLGHSHSRITADVYTHLERDHERRTARVLSGAVYEKPETPSASA